MSSATLGVLSSTEKTDRINLLWLFSLAWNRQHLLIFQGKGIQNIKITVFKSQINIFILFICIAIYTNTSNTMIQPKKPQQTNRFWKPQRTKLKLLKKYFTFYKESTYKPQLLFTFVNIGCWLPACSVMSDSPWPHEL